MSAQPLSIDWQWTDYQARVRDALEAGEHDLVVFRTGYGGGKSITGAQWIHRGALQADGGESLVMGQDFQKAEATTFKVFFERLPGENTAPDDAEGDPENSPIVAGYNEVKKRLTYITGHVARLGSADKWNRFAGGEFNRIWCDEVAHYENTDLYKLHEMLVTRQRTEQGPNTTLWTSTGNGYNQFYDVTERQVTPDDEPLPWADDMLVIVASTEYNELLPEDGLEKIRNQFEGTAREEQGLHGGFAAAEGLVYNDFTRDHHVVPEADVSDLVDEEQLPIYGYDAGWDHPRVLVQWRPTHHDQWIATKLYYVSEKPFEHLCDPSDEEGWVYEQGLERGYLYGEHEPEHLLKFKQAGFGVDKADKSLDEGIPHVRGLLERKGDPARPGLLVSDACSALIQEFLSYKEEHVGSSGDVPDHALDASRYALFTHTPRQDHGDDSSGVSYL